MTLTSPPHLKRTIATWCATASAVVIVTAALALPAPAQTGGQGQGGNVGGVGIAAYNPFNNDEPTHEQGGNDEDPGCAPYSQNRTLLEILFSGRGTQDGDVGAASDDCRDEAQD